LIEQVRARGHVPLLVGGTMLYAKALIDGLNNLPSADPLVRQALDEQAQQVGWPEMHYRLSRVDPKTAARLKPTDSQRIQRALEVFEITGRPMSALLAEPPARQDNNVYTRLALEPSDRSVLHDRIAARFEQMMVQGLEQEVRLLFERADLHIGLPSIRCVGYRQLWQWLADGAQPKARDAAVQSGIVATRQLAKRQLTWLRSMPDRVVIDCVDAVAVQRSADQVERWLTAGGKLAE
jgi:tRNA dimethylallyltransferase